MWYGMPMDNFEQWAKNQFSIQPLFDIARPDMPTCAGELAIGVFVLHHRARKSIWEKAEQASIAYDPSTANALTYRIALSQATNKGILEQELAGMTFRVEAQPHADDSAILFNDDYPLRRAIGSVSGAYPPSFRVENEPDVLRLYERDNQYVVRPLDANGMPQITMHYVANPAPY